MHNTEKKTENKHVSFRIKHVVLLKWNGRNRGGRGQGRGIHLLLQIHQKHISIQTEWNGMLYTVGDEEGCWQCWTEGGHLLPIGTRVNPPKVSNRWLAWWNQAFKNTALTAEPGGERQGRKTAEAVGARAQFQPSKLGNIKRRISRMVVRIKHDAWHTANSKETSPPPSSHWGCYSGSGYKVQME